MYIAVSRQRLAKVDQENLKEKMNLWKADSKDDFFEFHPYVAPQDEAQETNGDLTEEDDDDDSSEHNEWEEVTEDSGSPTKGLLFVHQTMWQRQLLNRYGNELCLLDATYCTTKYSLPLYFLVVKTNVDYKVVASFVTQSEKADAIKEALAVIKRWNPEWQPQHFMVDYATEEIIAVEELFPCCDVYICDFHREQAWDRWLSKGTNGTSHLKTQALAAMRCIARSASEEEFHRNLASLKGDDELWSRHLFQNWFEKTWLKLGKVSM
ncbi:hypothetical protein GJAV_G00089940 [Gymnothorax javanicus]|nr:hypothetical protein GJAV_G00089940 [Gymnothorax javanicus]